MSEHHIHTDVDPALVGAPFEVIEANRNVVHRFGDYVLVQQVGWGGHGVVYRAWQKSVRRWVALKFLHVGDAVAMQRFEREARVVAKLDHPNIVPLYDVGSFEGRAFITMKLIEGHTLENARLETTRALKLIAAAADAVQHAHEQGIVHRDLKPSNMMVSAEGHCYVMDFGLAQGLAGESKLTKTGVVNGTPSYMSPEHARGLTCDARSDVYSLGASLYELLGRRAPFEGATPVVVLASVISNEPLSVRHLNPNVTLEMDSVVAKAMDKVPSRRYQTAGAFAADVRRILAGQPVQARPLSAVPRAWRWVGRNRLVTAFFSLLAMGATAAVAASLFHAATMSRAQAQAERERRLAEEKLAQSLISQGDTFASSGRLADATANFTEAEGVLLRLGQSPLSARLGLMVARQSGSVPLISIAAHTAATTAVRFFPDGERVASASEDGTVRIWEASTGRNLLTFKGHADQVWSLAIAPDGRSVASGSSDSSVKVWDAQTGAVMHTFLDHKSRVGALVFSPDGALLYSGGEDNMIRAWDLKEAKAAFVLAGHKGRVRGLSISRNGKRLASGGGDNSVRLWDLNARKELRSMKDLAALFVVRFINDDTAVVAAGQEGDLTTWSLDGQLLDWVDANRSVISDLALEGELLVSAGWDARTRIFGLPKQEPLGDIETDGARVLCVDISPQGHFWVNGDSNGALRVFDLPTAARRPIRRRTFAPVTVEFTRDGRLAATWHSDPWQLVLWDVQTRMALRRLLLPAIVQRAAFAPQSYRLAAALGNREALLWNFATGDLRRWQTDAVAHSVRFAEDENRIWMGTNGGVVVLDSPALQPQLLLGNYVALRLATTRDGRYFATAGRGGDLGLWDAHTNKLLHWFKLGGTLTSVAFSPDGSRLAAGSAIHGAKLIDTSNGRTISLMKGLASQVFGIDVSPDGGVMVSGGSDRIVRLWDAHSGAELRTLPESSYAISNAAFADDGRVFVGTEDGTFDVWDPKIGPTFEVLRDRVDEARAHIQKGDGGPKDWLALGDWFSSRHVCATAVPAYDKARLAGWTAASETYARCLWSVGRQTDAQRELQAAVQAGLLPAAYAELLANGPPLSDAPWAVPKERHLDAPTVQKSAE